MARDDQPYGIISQASYAVTQAAQKVIEKVLAPYPPSPQHSIKGPQIAVVGAGITGVTAAAHCIGHGFDVQIFEAGDEKNLGGIWSVSAPFVPSPAIPSSPPPLHPHWRKPRFSLPG
jgi:heterodisulfide reductase subunit A-like polyferredoxin